MIINRIFLDEVHSTNAFAIDYIAKNTPIEGTVISTYNQTLGRGQIGRIWDSGKDQNLSFSIVLYPSHILAQNQFELNMLISCSLVSTLESLLSQKVYIKWPNDIIVDDKKIAGILIQSILTQNTIRSAVCGIGLNVLQNHFNEKDYSATSLQSLMPDGLFVLDILENKICEEVLNNYYLHKKGALKGLKHRYLQHMYRRGERVTFQILNSQKFFEAEILGIDQVGRLTLHVDNEIKYFQMGELKMLFND